MPNESNEELAKRIAELEKENRSLKQQASARASETPATLKDSAGRAPRNWPWALLSTVLILIGALLAPVAVAASWAKIELSDTDRFVATFAELARKQAIQEYVADEVGQAINQQVNVRQMTSEVIDGVTALGTGPAATKALDAMKGPAAAGIESLIHSTVGNFVSSDAFATVWTEALRISHTQFAGAMQNDRNAALQVGGDGSLGIQLAPVIASVKQALVAQGIDFANQIPEVDRTIVIAQSDVVPRIQLAYGLAVGAGAWLPWASLLCLTAGVLVARRKSVALIWAAIALALVMAGVLISLAIGRVLFISSVSPSLLPSDVADPMYATVAGLLQTISTAMLVLAVAVAVVAWYCGPFSTPQRLRGFFEAGTKRLRLIAQSHGISTGRTGEWLYRQRLLLRIVIAVAAALGILLMRPLTAGVIIWTLVGAIVAVLILELLQRPEGEVAVEPEAQNRMPVA